MSYIKLLIRGQMLYLFCPPSGQGGQGIGRGVWGKPKKTPKVGAVCPHFTTKPLSGCRQNFQRLLPTPFCTKNV